MRDVLLGALDEVTIEEAILTLQSRYEYVREALRCGLKGKNACGKHKHAS